METTTTLKKKYLYAALDISEQRVTKLGELVANEFRLYLQGGHTTVSELLAVIKQCCANENELMYCSYMTGKLLSDRERMPELIRELISGKNPPIRF